MAGIGNSQPQRLCRFDRHTESLLSYDSQLRDCEPGIETQTELVKEVVQRVYVNEDAGVALTLDIYLHMVLNHKL